MVIYFIYIPSAECTYTLLQTIYIVMQGKIIEESGVVSDLSSWEKSTDFRCLRTGAEKNISTKEIGRKGRKEKISKWGAP